MVATQPQTLGSNEDVGMLVLDHYYDYVTGCRVVVVRCMGDSVGFLPRNKMYSLGLQ